MCITQSTLKALVGQLGLLMMAHNNTHTHILVILGDMTNDFF